MSILDKVRSKYETPMQGTSKSSKSPSAGSAGSSHRHSGAIGVPSAGSAGSSSGHLQPDGNEPRDRIDLTGRIQTMAHRWGYSADELTAALAGAQSDPQGWLAWTELDEEQFGGCVIPADFAAAYARLRGLA